MTIQSSSTLVIGSLVITRDGTELGRVKEMQGECFKVDAPLAPDFWIASELVRDAGPGSVRLLSSLEDLRQEKDNPRDHSGWHVH